MRVVLIEASDPRRPSQVYMPMGLAYLQSWLERHQLHQVYLARSVDEAIALSPEVIGISAVSPNFPYAQELAQQLRQRSDAHLILGGPHISSSPETLPSVFSVGVRGEGEQILEELLELWSATSHPSDAQLASIRGLVYRDSQAQLHCNEARPLLSNIDEIPSPKRSWAQGNMPLWSFSSRGCPFHCTFCSTASFWSRYRLHSPAYVAAELKGLMEAYRPPMHIFMDDLFASNLERLRELKSHFERTLPYNIPLVATVRADLASAEICRALRDINVQYCHLGLESGSDRVLSYLKAQTTNVEINQRALDLLKENGLEAVGSFIIGAPNEEDEDIEATWKFIDTNLNEGKLKSFSFGPLVAFPGTKVWDYGCEHGLIDPQNIDWRLLDIDLRAFNLDSYLLLSPLERQRFGYWFERFHERWQRQFRR